MSFWKKANEEYNGSLEALYMDLYEGKTLEFDLLSVKPRFEYTKDFRIINKAEFHRKIKF